jgi:hypothetical protein
VKYDSQGNRLWILAYAGTALAVDSNANIYVAGVGTNFNTVKLSPTGSNMWLTTHVNAGPSVAQSVLVDAENSVYVSGLDSYMWVELSEWDPQDGYWAVALTTIKYGSNGNQIWAASQIPYYNLYNVKVVGAVLDSATNLYVAGNFSDEYPFAPYFTCKYASDGTLMWTASPASGDGYNAAQSMALNRLNEVVLTGVIYQGNNYSPPYISFGTLELSTNGTTAWTDFYPEVTTTTNVGTAIAVDSANNSYVTGYSPGTNTFNDIVTIKYGPNGNQIWLQRYNGPGNGNDAGNAIAVDNNGNVYVTGYDTTAAGGTEIVLIKYSPVTLQRRADGTVLLEAQGSPGESFDIQPAWTCKRGWT